MMKKSSGLKNVFNILILIILAGLAYFFIGVGFDSLNSFSKLVISLVFFAILFMSHRKGFAQFILVLFAWSTLFISLSVSFSSAYIGDSPLSLNIILNPWTIFLISTISSLLIWFVYEKISIKDKFAFLLFILYIIVWIILAFNVKYFGDWKLENYLTIPFLVLIYITYRWFRFSNLSYALIFVFMTLHIFGSHYTYSEVPFGFWLSSILGVARNHYDRIVHFSFGFLLAYPVREVFIRIANVKGSWALYIPIELVLAFSCIYEIIEWGIAILFGGDLGVAYLGTQGDVWDAQKDMALAGLGSLIAMILTSLILLYYKPRGFWKEFKKSLSVKSHKQLGEVAIKRISKKQ